MTEDMFPADTCYELLVGATASFSITGDSKYVAVDKVNAFYPEAFLSSFFGASKDGAYAERVCGIMEVSFQSYSISLNKSFSIKCPFYFFRYSSRITSRHFP